MTITIDINNSAQCAVAFGILLAYTAMILTGMDGLDSDDWSGALVVLPVFVLVLCFVASAVVTILNAL